jgi:prepilin-type N-terminal cleavage/methylation domain-containing protein
MLERPQRGLTLIELCFGLAIIALLSGLAAPGFRATLRAAAVRAAAHELMTGLQQARAEAITASRPSVLCPSGGGGCLAASVGAHAWQRSLEKPAEPGAVHALARGITLWATRSPVRFWPGSLSATTATLTICDDQRVATPRAIVISQTGRARFAAADFADCA